MLEYPGKSNPPLYFCATFWITVDRFGLQIRNGNWATFGLIFAYERFVFRSTVFGLYDPEQLRYDTAPLPQPTSRNPAHIAT